MDLSAINKKLDWVTNIFLQEEDDTIQLASAVQTYRELLTSLSSIDLTSIESSKNLHFKPGMALGARWAVSCIDDQLRTKRFIKAVYLAVTGLLAKGISTVHIMYAGTGPFAALVLPLTRKFSYDELQFTMLEINQISFDCLGNTIKSLQINKYIKTVENTDATKYIINDEDRMNISILLSETMQAALLKEQQVSIMASLAAQLGNEVLLIPNKIELQLALGSFEKFQQMEEHVPTKDQYKILGNFFELSDRALRSMKWNNGMLIPKRVRINIPGSIPIRGQYLCVLTKIELFADQSLDVNDSGLTAPRILVDLGTIVDAPSSVNVSYLIDKEPSIEFSFDEASTNFLN